MSPPPQSPPMCPCPRAPQSPPSPTLPIPTRVKPLQAPGAPEPAPGTPPDPVTAHPCSAAPHLRRPTALPAPSPPPHRPLLPLPLASPPGVSDPHRPLAPAAPPLPPPHRARRGRQPPPPAPPPSYPPPPQRPAPSATVRQSPATPELLRPIAESGCAQIASQKREGAGQSSEAPRQAEGRVELSQPGIICHVPTRSGTHGGCRWARFRRPPRAARSVLLTVEDAASPAGPRRAAPLRPAPPPLHAVSERVHMADGPSAPAAPGARPCRRTTYPVRHRGGSGNRERDRDRERAWAWAGDRER